jgi:spore coat polysaccharide biosynthesis predicted glycosyltransferase SpsG
MNILFRVDCNSSCGVGHFSRCVTLAKILLKEYNYKIYFLSINFNKKIYNIEKINVNFINFKFQKKVTEISDFKITKRIVNKYNIQAIVLDSYNLNKIWCNNIYNLKKKLIIIDDGLKKNIKCDIYINYLPLINNFKIIAEKKLLNLKYFFIDQKYFKLKKRNNTDIDIFINLGTGIFNSFLNFLLKIINEIKIIKKIIIIGNYNKNDFKNYNFKVLIYKKYIHLGNLINRSRICIGAGGVNLLERLFLNKYNIVFSTASHQERICNYLSRQNYIKYFGKIQNFRKNYKKNFFLKENLNKFNNKNFKLKSFNKIDGLGLKRVALNINQTLNEKKLS